jgi:hypothetical protein
MIRVNKSQFVFSHGKEPRGRGCWVLFVQSMPGKKPVEFMWNGLYSEAVSQCKKWINEQWGPASYATIVVGP